MKSPDMTPPAVEMDDLNISQPPTIDVSKAALKGMELEAAMPAQAPTQLREAVTAFEAAVWTRDKRVNALYTTLHARNSWMSSAGVGWKRLSTTNDSSSEAMTLLAAHCREKSCRIDYSEENGVIKEIYVW